MAFKLERCQLCLAVGDEGVDVDAIEPDGFPNFDGADFPAVYEAFQLADGQMKKVGTFLFVHQGSRDVH